MPEITVAGTNIRQISASSKKIRIPSGAPRPRIGTIIGFFTGFFNYFFLFLHQLENNELKCRS
ncbi:hypothetical protein, partial [Alistipes shahii]